MGIRIGSTEISDIQVNLNGTLTPVNSVKIGGATTNLWERGGCGTFYLEGVPAGTTTLGDTGKVVSTSAPATVNWGDGTVDTIAYSSNMLIPSHTYATAGDYRIVIRGSTLTEIGAVSSVYHPMFVETYGTGLTYLKRIVISGIENIRAYSFGDGTGLTSIEIGRGVTTIERSIASRVTSLASLMIGPDVTSIGSYCFIGCTGLTSITCKAVTPPTCVDYPFDNVPTSIPVYVPAASISAYQADSYWSRFTNYQAITA